MIKTVACINDELSYGILTKHKHYTALEESNGFYALKEVPSRWEVSRFVVVAEEEGNKPTAWTPAIEEKSNIELVNHPEHYKSNGLEAIDVIEAFNLNFNLGNTVKYILRCGKKDAEIQELKKALWYLEREIKNKEEQ